MARPAAALALRPPAPPPTPAPRVPAASAVHVDPRAVIRLAPATSSTATASRPPAPPVWRGTAGAPVRGRLPPAPPATSHTTTGAGRRRMPRRAARGRAIGRRGESGSARGALARYPAAARRQLRRPKPRLVVPPGCCGGACGPPGLRLPRQPFQIPERCRRSLPVHSGRLRRRGRGARKRAVPRPRQTPRPPAHNSRPRPSCAPPRGGRVRGHHHHHHHRQPRLRSPLVLHSLRAVPRLQRRRPLRSLVHVRRSAPFRSFLATLAPWSFPPWWACRTRPRLTRLSALRPPGPRSCVRFFTRRTPWPSIFRYTVLLD